MSASFNLVKSHANKQISLKMVSAAFMNNPEGLKFQQSKSFYNS